MISDVLKASVVSAIAVCALSSPVYAQAAGAANGLPQELVLGGASEQQVETPDSYGLQALLEKGRVGEVKLRNKKALQAFYELREYKQAWMKGSLLSQLSSSPKQEEELLRLLENSWKHGLNPEHYHVEVMRKQMEQGGASLLGGGNPTLDLLMSDAIASYAHDLTGMRVDARSLSLHPRYWREPAEGSAALDQALSAESATSYLRSLAPQGKLYKALQSELETLYRAPLTDEEVPVNVDGILRPGQSRKSVLTLRKRMGFEADDTIPAHFVYDDSLAQSVMAFQSAHGLKPDGIIGTQTLSVLNKTRDDRINQVLVNMERLRWLDQEKPDRYVVVNVPAAKLWAIEYGRLAFDMRVVVGRYKRQTNIFNTEMTGVRFNPTWTVPPTIKEEDFLPELQNDPLYLSNRGIELVHSGSTIDPTTIDWTAVTNNDLHGIQMVQQPSASNPLGQVRIFMANPYNIYLHDTNKRSYFERSNRALSSGCVRMEDAQRMAHFVMQGNDGWGEEKLQRILASGKKTDLAAEVPVPVYLLYQTIWFGDNGQLVYGHDIYDRDVMLRRALHDIDGVGYPALMSVAAPSIPTVPKRVYAAKRVKKPEPKKEESVVENKQPTEKKGSFSFLSGVKIEPKKKDGIDLLTFNE